MSYPYLSDVVKALTGVDVPLPLATFGLFVALAMLAAGECLRRELRRLYAAWPESARRAKVGIDVPPQDVVTDLLVFVLLAGVAGARLFHILEHTGQFVADPLGMIFSRSGLSIFGGLIFGVLAGLVCVRPLEIAGAAAARRRRAGDDARLCDRPDWLRGVRRRRLGHRREHGPQT